MQKAKGGLKPTTFMLWGDSANYSITGAPIKKFLLYLNRFF